MFVCLSSFHVIPIKTPLRTNWTLPICQWGLPEKIHCTDFWGRQEYHYKRTVMSQNAISQEGVWYSIYQSLFWFPFLVSSSFYAVSLIVWKGGWGSTPTFLSECPPLTRTATLSHFFHRFLTTGCNYLMRVLAYPDLTPPHTSLSCYMCCSVSAWILICSFSLFTVCLILCVCLTNQSSKLIHAPFLLSWANCRQQKH